MDNPNGMINPAQLIEIVFRRRWCIIAPFCLALIAGIYLAVTLPKTYEASTLILVEAQRVPQNYVQSVVSLDFDTRINTISQQILSRTNLEKISNELNLFTEKEFQNMYLEDKIANLRKRISVDVTQSRGRGSEADSFSISFKGENPEEVVRVVNTLSTYFIDENLKVREEQAVGTSDFLEGELLSMRKKLEEVEEKMKEYRRTYMGELPEQLESNLRIFDRIEEQLIERKQRLSEEQQRLISFENQLMAPTATALAPNASMGQTENLEQLKERLANLKTKYTIKHPDIVRLQKTIGDLEKTEMAKRANAASGEKDSEVAARSRLSPSNKRQLDDMRRLNGELERDIADLVAQRVEYRLRIENTPKREQELMSLKRDYQNIKESYSSLLNRKLEAEISVNMEKKQKGERFRVIDSAKKPEKPVEPNMEKLFLFTIAAGLGIGAGIIFVLEYLNTSFRRTDEVEAYLDIPVIATIPKIFHKNDLLFQRLHQLATVCSIIISFGLLTSFALIILKGPETLLTLIR